MENVIVKVKRAGSIALLMGVLGMALSACGGEAATATPPPAPTATTAAAATTGDSTGSTSDTASANGAEQEVNITLTEWAITPSNIEVNAGKVKFTVTNKGQFKHNADFLIEGAGDAAKTKDFTSSENPQTIELTLQPGTYTMVCSIPGHAEHGMKGTLVVK